VLKNTDTHYEQFIANKRRVVNATGIEISEKSLNKKLMDWQKRVVAWAIRRGRAALFEDCGMGKTFQQLEWARVVYNELRRIPAQSASERTRLDR